MEVYSKKITKKELLDMVKINKKVLIFGTGLVAKNISLLLAENMCSDYISCYIVSRFDANPYFFLNRLVYLADEIDNEQRNENIIVASMPNRHNEIIKYLSLCGYTNILVLKESFYETLRNDIDDSELISYKDRIKNVYMWELYDIYRNRNYDDFYIKSAIRAAFDDYSKGKYKMTRLVVMLGTKCSLRCRDCANLIPYISPQKDLPINIIIRSLEQIFSNCDTILRCELIGGEPFLSKNLVDVLKFLLSQDIVYQIELTSNGTILPSDDIVAILKNDRVKLFISEYTQLENNACLFGHLEEKNIPYTKLRIDNWIQAGSMNKRNRSMQEIQYLYQRCMDAFFCKTLYNGCIYSCARSAGLSILGKMKEQEYLQIDDTLTSQKLRCFCELETSMACDYCDYSVDEIELVVPAIQLKSI